MSPETLRALSTSAEKFKMEIDLASSYRTTHGFEKLNGENYATWAFDVKYQFLKEKLWGPVSGTELRPHLLHKLSMKAKMRRLERHERLFKLRSRRAMISPTLPISSLQQQLLVVYRLRCIKQYPRRMLGTGYGIYTLPPAFNSDLFVSTVVLLA